MAITIFIIFSLFVIIATVYFTIKNKIVCPSCKSDKIKMTGNKNYKEEPAIALMGSPDSYYEFEYECTSCGNKFWEKNKAVITN